MYWVELCGFAEVLRLCRLPIIFIKVLIFESHAEKILYSAQLICSSHCSCSEEDWFLCFFRYLASFLLVLSASGLNPLTLNLSINVSGGIRPFDGERTSFVVPNGWEWYKATQISRQYAFTLVLEDYKQRVGLVGIINNLEEGGVLEAMEES